jgi:hypothetical protein
MDPVTLTINVQPYTKFWHVYMQSKPMVSISKVPCADCAATGKTLAGNTCRYCMGATTITKKETAPPANEWKVSQETYDYAKYDDEGLRFIEERYQCGETDTYAYMPADCFATEGEAMLEAAARNHKLKSAQ